MEIIPVQAVPSQVFSVQLGGQGCRIALYQKSTGLYLDFWLSTQPIAVGVLCHTGTRLVLSPSSGFAGDIMFLDMQPSAPAPPSEQVAYEGLGTRYVLAYLP